MRWFGQGGLHERGHRRGASAHFDPPGLDAGQVEQFVDDALQPLTIFPTGIEQVGLFLGERASGLFEHKWSDIRREVSGVRNSWATVATRSFFNSSKRRNRVTSCRMTVAPEILPCSS